MQNRGRVMVEYVANVIQVSSDIAGLVTEVMVQDNQTVKKGRSYLKLILHGKL